MSAMCYGSVLPIISVEVISQLRYGNFLKGFRISSLLIVRGGLPLCWAVNCGIKTFHHSLSLFLAYSGAKESYVVQ